MSDIAPASHRSLIGLRAVNFFLAEVVGVIFAFLNDFLRQHRWSYTQIGVATAAVSIGTFLCVTPAGIVSDRIKNRRRLLAITSIVLGVCYGILPLFPDSRVWTIVILFCSGAAASFFIPLLAALALSLVGRKQLDPTMGTNQLWNHAGNITAALLTLLMVKLLGISSVFYVLTTLSFLAAASLLLIRSNELNPDLAFDKEERRDEPAKRQDAHDFLALLKDRRVQIFLLCLTLFHIANAPVMPLVGMYLKKLGGGDDQVALVVLIAQVVMAPVAWLAGRFSTTWGRKVVFSIAFVVLPIRIFLYSLTSAPALLLAIQALDGVSAGIYGVVTALVCSDLTRGKERFNSLMGLSLTAVALGAVLGPLAQGVVTDRLGFPMTFRALAVIAAIGAVLFIWKMPETQAEPKGSPDSHSSLVPHPA